MNVSLFNRRKLASRALQAGFALGALLLSLPSTAAENETELHYSVYVGGLYLGGIDARVSQSDNQYKIVSTAATNEAFNWAINWIAEGETEGLIGLDKFFPRQHQHKSTWNSNVRVVTLDYATSGTVSVQKTGSRPEPPEKYTPVDPASLTNSIDPMTAILAVTKRLEKGEDCNVKLPIFDGHRRYDAILTEKPTRVFKPSRYSVFEGAAIGCKIEIVRKGGFLADPTYERNPGQDLVVWAGPPVDGGKIVPVRMQVETPFGAMELHLDSYRDGSYQLIKSDAK